VILIALAAAAIAGAPPPPINPGPFPPSSTPQTAARDFYMTYLASPAGGIPEGRQRARLRPLLSYRLNTLIDEAYRAEVRHARRTRGREPPVLEGDIFTSLFEGAGRFEVMRCRSSHARSICQISLVYNEPRSQPAHWRDQLVLTRAGSRWVVDDVIYGGDWQFGNKGRLSLTLRNVIDGQS